MAGMMGVTPASLGSAMTSLNTKISKIQNVTMGGLLKGGFIIQRDAQQHVPVEYGNLRGSAFTRKAMAGGLSVEVGFGAAYAVFVHENMEQKLKGEPRPSGLGVYWGPSGEPKFLANAAHRQTEAVLAAVGTDNRSQL